MEALAWIVVGSIVLACLITWLTEPKPERRVLLVNSSDLPVFDSQAHLNRRRDYRSPEQRQADQARVDALGFP